MRKQENFSLTLEYLMMKKDTIKNIEPQIQNMMRFMP